MADHREQRLQAVAKLKRAASLPRMKDGRRPPMHVDGVSEGERANTDEESRPTSPPPEENQMPIRPKRRSRSRSRSRGSKDYKNKIQPGDSSQDEAFNNMSVLPPPTPLPSLETLSKNLNLFRSNSAGRMMAMHKLTNGTESYDVPSPSPPPLPGKFRRTNTVSGGERNAARAKMFTALAGRSNKDNDSAGEDPVAPSPSPTPKRRRRRSRRTSTPGLSDSEFVSTSQNTPLVPPTPLPIVEIPVDRPEEPIPQPVDPPRRRSVLVEEEDEQPHPEDTVYLNSPFTSPLKEKQEYVTEEEEQVLYSADTSYASRYDDNFDREISWIASPGTSLFRAFSTLTLPSSRDPYASR